MNPNGGPPQTPDGSMPAGTPAGSMTAGAAENASAGPVYGQIAYLENLVDKQHDYIAQLEKHIAALQAYIQTLRQGRH